MAAAVEAIGRRYLPCGWKDLGRQLAIWFGFLSAYEVARGVADRDPAQAFENGLRIAGWEQRVGSLFEVTAQKIAASSTVLEQAVAWTYWNSEFTVVGLALLWVYLRRHDRFLAFRNWILATNLIGLVGYVLLPTAPPRMFPSFGFADTLARFGGLNHGSSLVTLAANPYAAMPSLHAADSLIVGVSLALITRRWWAKTLWLVWPLWVWFSVVATGNHFWLDIAAGILVALIGWAVVHRRALIRPAATAPRGGESESSPMPLEPEDAKLPRTSRSALTGGGNDDATRMGDTATVELRSRVRRSLGGDRGDRRRPERLLRR